MVISSIRFIRFFHFHPSFGSQIYRSNIQITTKFASFNRWRQKKRCILFNITSKKVLKHFPIFLKLPSWRLDAFFPVAINLQSTCLKIFIERESWALNPENDQNTTKGSVQWRPPTIHFSRDEICQQSLMIKHCS